MKGFDWKPLEVLHFILRKKTQKNRLLNKDWSKETTSANKSDSLSATSSISRRSLMRPKRVQIREVNKKDRRRRKMSQPKSLFTNSK